DSNTSLRQRIPHTCNPLLDPVIAVGLVHNQTKIMMAQFEQMFGEFHRSRVVIEANTDMSRIPAAGISDHIRDVLRYQQIEQRIRMRLANEDQTLDALLDELTCLLQTQLIG